MKKHFFQLLLIGIFINFSNVSCKKEKGTETDKTPSSQCIELNISYSGTAQTLWGEKHKLYFLIDYGTYTPYENFCIEVSTNDMEAGKTISSPYKFEPGYYEISGFWDWNDSDSWDDYEPYISPVNIDITGFERPLVNIYVVDKANPNDKGWIEGGIYYNGPSLGSHHVYIIVDGMTTPHDTIKVTNDPYNFSSGCLGYLCGQLPSNDYYVLEVYWDINDDGKKDDKDPIDAEVGIYVVPGLPTYVDFTLK